jgi:uncharacterized membrane protein YfcA
VDLALAALIVAGAAVVRGAAGFGFALVAAPLLAFIWPPVFATSLVLLLDLVATALMVRGGALADVRRDDALVVGTTGTLGAVTGVLLIKYLPQDAARLGLDLAVLVSSAAVIFRVRAPVLGHWGVGAVIGFVVGALIGAFAIGGSLLLAWLMTAGRTPKETRGLMTLVFGLTDTLALGLRVAFGVFPGDAAVTGLLLTPVMAAGIFAGGLVFHRAPAELWRRGVALLLILVAGMSLTHTLFFG